MLRSNALVSSSILVNPLIVQIQVHRPATIANLSTGSEPLFFQMSHLGQLYAFSNLHIADKPPKSLNLFPIGKLSDSFRIGRTFCHPHN